MKKRLITIIVAVAVLAALVVVIMTVSRNAAVASRPVTRTSEVRHGELTLSISASGAVQSGNSHSVYSTLAFRVDAVFVQEGDYVEKGDVLAQLDTESLKLDIRQQLASLDSADTNTDLDIDARLRSYQDARERASLNVDNSRRSYELLASQVYDGVHPEIVSARTAVDNARDALDNAGNDLENRMQSYNDSEFMYGLGELSRQSLDNNHAALEASQRAFDSAQRAYDSAVSNQQNLLRRLYNDVETARRNFESTQLASQQEVAGTRRSYENAVAAASNEPARINLERLENQLRDATITAPISGTVTNVYAKESAPGNGLLFIIEDLQSLEIATRVREFDVTDVQPGMPVIIRSDATGDRDIQGTVKSIAPTSERTVAGATIRANVVEYETIVTVDEPDAGLKIGMNTRMRIVLDTKESVLHVPYDAVFEAEDGSFSLFVVDEVSLGSRIGHVVRSIPVSLGLETDFAVEVSGEGLFEGLRIVSNPLSATEGAEVRIN